MREDACSELLDHLAKRDPEIKSFLNALHHFFPNTLYSISCRPCTNTTAAGLKGYFNSGPRVARIILCSDSLRPSELRSTLIHELTHAFDHARPGTFATELHRTACTEVRASLLGQCREITNLEGGGEEGEGGGWRSMVSGDWGREKVLSGMFLRYVFCGTFSAVRPGPANSAGVFDDMGLVAQPKKHSEEATYINMDAFSLTFTQCRRYPTRTFFSRSSCKFFFKSV
ncbi:hypothetical protein G7K_1629-t1 [Saitoella complicata NRRL Y-17804]|uniref:Mitochondrial inner membrane protease ATP23 n=1 Tax=Saitoella complicata (strain BCRC 22490 / CBS 7301 / JCM 7358 / NBRC 10748 / NRRL Y-17804) TaxID=698492 RepID=A0A0E9NCJ9_SAICN|nr:hypothetical protein G7K_1629-t1 [Saitoella complicata NRRL Y-17804]